MHVFAWLPQSPPHCAVAACTGHVCGLEDLPGAGTACRAAVRQQQTGK